MKKLRKYGKPEESHVGAVKEAHQIIPFKISLCFLKKIY